jgi:hypothetical protein
MLKINNYRKLEDKYNIKSVIEEEYRYIIRYDKGIDTNNKINWEVVIKIERINNDFGEYVMVVSEDNLVDRYHIVSIDDIKDIEKFYTHIEGLVWNTIK